MNKHLKNRLVDSRIPLLAGFGYLLLAPMVLLYWTGQEENRASRQIELVRLEYIGNNKLLNDLKSDVINGGTFLRDYLLEPRVDAAELHREAVKKTRADALRILSAKQLQESGEAYQGFLDAYGEYWRTIEPVLEWDAAKRRADGYAFLKEEASGRRSTMLGLAAKIGVWNEKQLARGEQRILTIFEKVQDSHRRNLVFFLIVGLSLTGFVYWRITTLERQASERFEQAESARQEASNLSARLLAVQEEERKSISRELHDGVAQNLSALRLGLEDHMRSLPEAQRSELEPLSQIAEETLKITRNLSLLLRPSMLDDLGLVPALRWLAREWQRRGKVRVEVEATEDLDSLTEEQRICVFRVAQEAIANSIQHGEAKTVTVRASQGGGKLLVSIQDDGKSFDVKEERGMGILGMNERVAKLGGKFSIVSKPGVGSVVMAELPA